MVFLKHLYRNKNDTSILKQVDFFFKIQVLHQNFWQRRKNSAN